MSVKVKIKMKGQDAKNALGMSTGANMPEKSRGKELMSENPESRQAENTNKSEDSQITKEVKKTLVVPSPEAEPVQGYDVLKRVDRTRKDDSPEAARARNNAVRDDRTVLGRCKPALIEL
jgi:hypothetical protein